MGGTSSRIRKKALRDRKHDLKAMLLDVRRDEISYYQLKEIEAQKPERRREETNRITAVQPALKCRNYGRAPHQGTVCLAKGKQCNKCGKPNHFARVCLSKQKENRRPGQIYTPQDAKVFAHSHMQSQFRMKNTYIQ